MQPLRVFIVDDDRDFAESLSGLMEVEGYDVALAHSGEDAVEMSRTHEFDITFMDVRLPAMNGVESFMEIRKFKPDAKVVLMTAYSVEQLLLQGRDAGALAVLRRLLQSGR